MLDNPQTLREIPEAYRISSIEYSSGVIDGKKIKQRQVIRMLQEMQRTWVRPTALNFRVELSKIIEKVELLDTDELR